jgi:hypothetical protein
MHPIAQKMLGAESMNQMGVAPTAGIRESNLRINAKMLMAVVGKVSTDASKKSINNP